MRRLILVALGVAVAGLVIYRQRTIDRWEQELALGRYADRAAGGRATERPQPSSAPSWRNSHTLVSSPPP